VLVRAEGRTSIGGKIGAACLLCLKGEIEGQSALPHHLCVLPRLSSQVYEASKGSEVLNSLHLSSSLDSNSPEHHINAFINRLLSANPNDLSLNTSSFPPGTRLTVPLMLSSLPVPSDRDDDEDAGGRGE
jgi:hypothetical protein